LGVELPEEVVTYFAENINANIREIEGALSALVANSSFLGRKITITLAKEVLKMYVKISPKEISIDHIRKIVCNYLNIEESVFDSPKRTRDIAQARQIAMYMSRNLISNCSLSTIGAEIGGKDHATVLHACTTVSDLMSTDKTFKQYVTDIEKLLVPVRR
jgi:chromosomal replication initiator protein